MDENDSKDFVCFENEIFIAENDNIQPVRQVSKRRKKQQTYHKESRERSSSPFLNENSDGDFLLPCQSYSEETENCSSLQQKIEALTEKLRIRNAEKEILKYELKQSKGEYEKAYREMALLKRQNRELEDELRRVRNLNYEYQDGIINEFRQSGKMNIKTYLPQPEIREFKNFCLPTATINDLSSRYKGARFVKSLAMHIWGEEELVKRSVTGTAAPNTKTQRPCLSPEKLDAIRELYREHLMTQGYKDMALKDECNRMNKYIGEKICDLRKACKRKSLQPNCTIEESEDLLDLFE